MFAFLCLLLVAPRAGKQHRDGAKQKEVGSQSSGG
jgi:gas vesicle protein